MLRFYQSQGEISLAPRAIMELEHYLTDVYEEDIRHCHLCKEIVLKVCKYFKTQIFIV